MDRRVFVHLDYGGFRGAVGQLWLRARQRGESASFLYEPDWLAHSGRFAIDPALDLRLAAFHTRREQEVFGVFSDAAPDRWGRRLLQRAEARRAGARARDPEAADGGGLPARVRRRDAAGRRAVHGGTGRVVPRAAGPFEDPAARRVAPVAGACRARGVRRRRRERPGGPAGLRFVAGRRAAEGLRSGAGRRAGHRQVSVRGGRVGGHPVGSGGALAGGAGGSPRGSLPRRAGGWPRHPRPPAVRPRLRPPPSLPSRR